MKIIIVLIIVLTFSNVYSQTTVLIDETFESGNSFTLVNGTQTNKWVRSTAVSKDGTYSLYVTNNTSGSPPPAEYSNSSPNTYVHAHRTISFPAGYTSIYLTFWVKGLGSGSLDALSIYDCPSTTVPWPGTANNPIYRIGISNYSRFGEWIKCGIQLSTSDAGTSRMIIFQWQNDNTTISNPSISIDNIKLTASVPSSLNGIYTIDNTTSTSGTNFNDFVDAVLRLNSDGISGPVTFNVSSGQTFYNLVPVITATGTSTNTITFQKSGINTNPLIKGTYNSVSPAGIINISGSDYFTFDGIDLAEISDGTYLTTNYGLYITGLSGTNGARNNIFKNLKITHNRGNTNSRAIYQNSSATNVNGANSYNIFQNITIENVYQGIYVNGVSGFPDLNLEISNCSIGGNTPDDIGNGSSTINGIRLNYVTGANVFGNIVRNLTVTGANSIYAIYLQNIQGTNNVYKNKVCNIKSTSSSTSSVVYGIRADINASQSCYIYNNFIYGLEHGITNPNATMVIRALATGVNGTGTGYVYFNSVRLDEDAAPTGACMYFGTGFLYSKNNILANFSIPDVSSISKKYCIYTTTGTLSDVNYNNYYMNPGNFNFIGYSGTDRTTLADWQSGSGVDANSKSVNPQFFSLTDLHSTCSFLYGAGTQIASITSDIDGDARTNPPCIGADEFPPVKSLGTIVYNQASTSTVNPGTSNNEILRIDLPVTNNYGSLKLNSIEFTSLNTTDEDISSSGVKLYVTSNTEFSTSVQLGSSVSFSSGKATFSGLNYELTGDATTYLWLSYDIVTEPTHGNILDAKITPNAINISGETSPSTEKNPSGNRSVVVPMSGTYTINNAGNGPRNYTSFTDAVNDLNSRTLSGPVIFDVSIGQIFTGPINITQTGTPTNTITFRKSSFGTKPVVEYSGSSGTESIVTLNGSDYITFDEIEFRATSGSSAVEYGFYFSGASDNGCSNNIIKNCIIRLDRTNTNSRCIFLNSVATSSNGTNSNNNFYNNIVSNSYNAYYFNGNSSFKDLNNTIDALEGGTSYIANIGGGSLDVNIIYYTNQNNINISNAIIQSNSSNSGYVRGIYSPSDNSSATITNNLICNIRTSGVYKICDGILISSGNSTQISNNTIYDLIGEYSSGASGVRGIFCNSTNATVFNNEIYNLSNTALNPNNSVKGIQSSGNIYSNNIHDLSSTIEIVTGIESIGTSGNIYQNRIYNLNYSGTDNRHVSGIYSGGGIKNVFNNLIYNLSAQNSSSEYSTRGLGFGAGTINLFYNSVYLSYVSQNSSNGSCVLNIGNSVTSIDIRNNIFINAVDVTTGTRATCIQKGNTNYSNISLNSNYNLFYTGSSTDPKKLIFYDGTNSEQTLSGYKTRIGSGRDAYSVSSDPGLNSELVPQPDNYKSWIINGKGTPISGYSTDFAGNPRSVSVSTGATDIGSYEFTPSVQPFDAIQQGIIADNSTTSYVVAENTVARITWHGFDFPTSVSLKYKSGTFPENVPPSSKYANVYSLIEPTGGNPANYTYDIKLFYTPALIGSISLEENVIMAKYSSSWSLFYGVINTTEKSISVSGLSGFSVFTFTDSDFPLPIKLRNFLTIVSGRNISLKWNTESEVNNSGFDIERKKITGEWIKAGFVQGNNKPSSYEFTDKNLSSGKYEYRLKQIDFNGNFEYHNLDGYVEVGVPAKFDLSQNYPNPFNPVTKINFDLPKAGQVSLKVFDILGKEVKTLVNEFKDAGYYSITFDASGLPSGVYFYRISAGEFSSVKKLILLK